MATMSEKLRRGLPTGLRMAPSEQVRSDAADLMDEMAKVIERLEKGEWSDEGHTALRDTASTILTRFREAG